MATIAKKQPATKKSAAKKSAAKKPAAKKSAARKVAAKKATVTATVDTATATLDEMNDRVTDALDKSAKFARDAAHTYIGVGLVIQDRLARRDFTTTVGYTEFLEQAKTMGHDRVVEIRDRVEPYAKRITDRIEPITDRIESTLPQPVKDAVDASRDRVRVLLAV